MAAALQPGFPQFQRLPLEVKILIWKEARPRHRHCFHFNGRLYLSSRAYKAIELKSGREVSRLCRSLDPNFAEDLVDLEDGSRPRKVRLPYRIFTYPEVESNSLHYLCPDDTQSGTRRVHAYMNFIHDVFCFTSATHGYPSCLSGIDLLWYPRRLPSDHFFFQVQKLALPITMENEQFEKGQVNFHVTDYEYEILGRSKALKTIYVVVEHDWDCELGKGGGLSWNEDGFVSYAQFVCAHSDRVSSDGKPVVRCDCNLDTTAGDYMKKKLLEGVFKDSDIKPNVHIVVERRLACGQGPT